MAIIFNYYVDKDLYYELEQDYPMVVSTTEHICGNDIITHLQIGANHGMRLNNMLNHRFNRNISFEQFFLKKARKNGEPKSISSSVFEKKLKSFDMRKMSTALTIVQEYTYINKVGKSDTVQIAIRTKGESMTATIDFQTVEQCVNFVCPSWLEDYSSRISQTTHEYTPILAQA